MNIAAVSSIALVVIIAQLFALVHKVPKRSISIQQQPVALARFGGETIGYVRGQHGAVFVRLAEGAPVSPPPAGPEASEVDAAMREELRRIPLKAAAEALWYIAVIFGALYIPLSSAWDRCFSRLKLAILGAVSFASALALFQLPLSFGYDTSMFSTWAGPGALSSSGGHLRISGNTGLSVSYRIFLEALVLPAMRAIAPVYQFMMSTTFLEPERSWLFWASLVTLFWAAVGLLVGMSVAALRRS